MLDNLKLEKTIFIDIETVSQEKHFSNLSSEWQSLWERKASFWLKEKDDTPESIYHKAGIYAEFGKVICISVGIVRILSNKRVARIKSFYGKTEKDILTQFCDLLSQKFQSTDYILCAHNGKEFDFPFLARRMLVNGIPLPYILDIAGRKPWEVQHLDTLQLWKFGDYKHYTSLSLLCKLFNISSPKNDIEGADVGKVFWEEDDLPRIVKYCQNDTLAVIQLMLAYKGLPQLSSQEITFIE